MENVKITLHYLVENGGDGSAYPKFFSTAAKRDEYLEKDKESSCYEGWGEDCTGSITVKADAEGNLQEETGEPEYRNLDPEYVEYD